MATKRKLVFKFFINFLAKIINASAKCHLFELYLIGDDPSMLGWNVSDLLSIFSDNSSPDVAL